MQHVFLINPHAGKQNHAAQVYAMAEHLRTRHGLCCTCLLTSRPGGAESLARETAQSGDPVRLYACGGDGTVSEVANGIAGYPNAAMTVIPSGTGNDFLKNFGPDAARFSDVESLWDGPSFPLDLIDCNGRLCLTIACSGIDAQIADGIDQFRRIPLLHGRASYLCSVAVNGLLRPLGHAWTVTLDGVPQTGKFALVSVCNGRHYGGGSTPVPEARMDDGILHTILIRAVPRCVFARFFPAYSAGRWQELPADLVQVVQARETVISAPAPFTTCLDGECFHWQEARLVLSARKVNFFGPKGCSPNATARGSI